MQTSLQNLQQQQLKPPTNPPSTTEIQQDDAWDANLIEADDDYDIYNNNNNKKHILDTTDDVFKNYYNGNDELSMLHIIGLIVLIGGLLFVVKRSFSGHRWRDTIPNRRRSAMF